MEESAIMAFIRKYLWLWVVIGMVFVSVVISIIFMFICKCISRKRGQHKIHNVKNEFNFKTESNKYQQRNIETGTPPLPPRTQFLLAEAQSYENLAEESQSIHDYEDGNCEQNVSNHEESIHDYEESTELQADYIKMEGDIMFPPPPIFNSMSGSVLEAQSYENLAEESQSIHDYEDGNCEQNVSNHEESIHDYEDGNCEENVSNHEESIHDYEESTELQADYIKMEGDIMFPPPPVVNSMSGSVLEAQSYENLAEENDYVESVDNQLDYVKMDEEDQAGDNTSTEDYDDIGGEEEDEEDYDDVG
ncbi:ring-infected erythrocyte surface antigen isoform X3 [Haplochromis burtoni]|uniref:ring-infected erythrocyte surface antigen isoform X3 n=1 Tax=Haplochromis burtoni TaxID=8153 RepID=UPI001C2D508D|nr:ring-infected erythrocyte surface antigen isoform X3 [Haplochromis burtoni]